MEAGSGQHKAASMQKLQEMRFGPFGSVVIILVSIVWALILIALFIFALV